MTTTRKFAYFRDEKDQNRVLCIARELNKEAGVVKFGWSVNVPPRWEACESRTFVGKLKIPGDPFCRKIGRELAIERLEQDPTDVRIAVNKRPINVCLLHLSLDPNAPAAVRRIAADSLRTQRQKQQNKKGWFERFRDFVLGQ